MCNIEKDTGGWGIQEIQEIRIWKYFFSREYMTKRAGHTACAVCLLNDIWPSRRETPRQSSLEDM